MDLFLCNYQDHLPTGFHKLDLSGDIKSHSIRAPTRIAGNTYTLGFCWITQNQLGRKMMRLMRITTMNGFRSSMIVKVRCGMNAI